ncbi:tRNA (guanine-N(7)-)-methyltransferase non-catalytic subunit wuho [Phytophthora citrophthora]|uniref:tRNA (Guanine-N(7)-)-methyltransferase non-catalytic subunit wuho n=1 Tax=Phytophthora citrophthora TaxID=4793 RepID=A0AAD9LDL9_9STRA|nr:tRNA (guanine-N(7)-)-methyltransferase non-catalytic subunit wuho [Phytophthora citrophthora]
MVFISFQYKCTHFLIQLDQPFLINCVKMVATGVFVAAAQGVVVTVRNTTVFVLPSSTQNLLRFEVLQGADGVVEPTEDEEEAGKGKKKQATQPAPPANRITTLQLFQPQGSELLALLFLVDERRLVHYELNLKAETLVLKASRSVPRSATCMAVGHLKLPTGETKYAVIVGQKTGEAVAVPFPDVDRDLKTLLGHTTSMVTHVAVNHDSSLLLTADRDEKLRVSRFPNAAIIESYCLGHAASLTKVACSAVTPDLVVSTSMDNTLKLWQMSTGKLLASEPLLPGVEVSLEPLDEDASSASDDSGRKAAKSLINVSLAICPKTNVVAVLVNYQHVRFFDIVADTLKEMAIPTEVVKSLLANEPCELLFTENEELAVSYKKAPFLQLFSISKGDNKRLAPVETSTAAFNDFRAAAATIELIDDEEKALDVLEDGLKKKKARTGEWNKKVPGEN